MLGMSDGAERLHAILELATDSPPFLHDVAGGSDFSRNPLFAAVHESCYADGGVTAWSAERTLPREFDDVELFTGEHVYPWMFDDYAALRPLREAAELLALHPWPRLYDESRLAANEVPVAAVVYANDMYVDRELSEETAGRVGNLRRWLTDEYEHDGIRADGGAHPRPPDLARAQLTGGLRRHRGRRRSPGPAQSATIPSPPIAPATVTEPTGLSEPSTFTR